MEVSYIIYIFKLVLIYLGEKDVYLFRIHFLIYSIDNSASSFRGKRIQLDCSPFKGDAMNARFVT